MSGSTTYESPSIFQALKDSAHDLVTHPVSHITGIIGNPVASGNKAEPYEGKGGADANAARNATIDAAS